MADTLAAEALPAAGKKLKNFKKLFLFLSFFCPLLFFSCKTTDFRTEANSFSSDVVQNIWQEKNYFIAQINLDSQNLELKSYPKKSGWIKPKSVKSFAKENSCFAAINANPFEQKSRLNPFSKQKPIGIYIDSGTKYSPMEKRYAAIAFYKNENKNGFYAKIFDEQIETEKTQSGKKIKENSSLSSQTESEKILESADFAFGGFWTILRSKEICDFKDIKDHRSAAGLSKDGKSLFLFCGKKLSYKESAEILKEKGAYYALQLDGGSSSQFYFNGKNRQKKAKTRTPVVIFGFTSKNH